MPKLPAQGKGRDDAFPENETADLAAAILARIFRVGFIGFLFAALPTTLLLWQNFLIRDQIQLQAQQIAQQTEDNLFVRRAQLVAILYEENCENKLVELAGTDESRVISSCRPRASVRARQEAAWTFVTIELGRNVASDLASAHLSSTNLSDLNLRGANLQRANATDVNLADADLQGANLAGAHLRGSKLDGADLRRASLRSTDLGRATLRRANLRGAFLDFADLSEAVLTPGRRVRPDSSTEVGVADLTNASLRRARLVKADLTSADLTGADLTNAVLLEARLVEANLTGANLEGADLTDADLTGADFREAIGLTREQLRVARNLPAHLPPGLLTDSEEALSEPTTRF